LDLQLLLSLLAVAIVLLVGFPVHEFSHAFAAFRLGDSTARWQGRLTLNPIKHFDPLGGLMLVISSISGFFIGWAKPTPVNPYNLRFGRRGESIVALSGPLSNLIMAAVVAVPIRLIASNPGLRATIDASAIGSMVHDVALIFVVINGFLFMFNLLPIPPLDGWKVLIGLVDARTAYTLRQFEQYGFILLLILVLVGSRFLSPIADFITAVLLGPARPLSF
jgi:Zn-dependent protease